jgi:hypothetical protein
VRTADDTAGIRRAVRESQVPNVMFEMGFSLAEHHRPRRIVQAAVDSELSLKRPVDPEPIILRFSLS